MIIRYSTQAVNNRVNTVGLNSRRRQTKRTGFPSFTKPLASQHVVRHSYVATAYSSYLSDRDIVT